VVLRRRSGGFGWRVGHVTLGLAIRWSNACAPNAAALVTAMRTSGPRRRT